MIERGAGFSAYFDEGRAVEFSQDRLPVLPDGYSWSTRVQWPRFRYIQHDDARIIWVFCEPGGLLVCGIIGGTGIDTGTGVWLDPKAEKDEIMAILSKWRLLKKE